MASFLKVHRAFAAKHRSPCEQSKRLFVPDRKTLSLTAITVVASILPTTKSSCHHGARRRVNFVSETDHFAPTQTGAGYRNLTPNGGSL